MFTTADTDRTAERNSCLRQPQRLRTAVKRDWEIKSETERSSIKIFFFEIEEIM